MSATYCLRCGVPIGYWHFGWKHQNSGTTGLKSCGQKPLVPTDRRQSAEQVSA